MAENEEKKDEQWLSQVMYGQHPSLRKLEPLEKQFLLAVEHGDIGRVGRILHMISRNPNLPLDINCKDPVGRSATLLAIDNENLEMLEYLLECGAESRDALLHAINAEYVEAVDLLLEHEELVHKEGEPHSWEKVDRDISTFTTEITPLILAAHKDNYEILKILSDRGASLPMPHDVRCCCIDCVQALEEDCLCHSRSRINAYRALSSPSLICLSSIDPILTAFELSWELRRLSNAENEFKLDYVKLRSRCQDFATHLLDHARSSRELEMVLNYDPTRPPYQHGDHMPLARLEMAIKYKQKQFIAHPNVQQLLSTLWYDGLPGFRKQNPIYQLWDIIKIGVLFPFYSIMYMIFPNTKRGRLVRKPFFKFIIHSFSYLFFLFLLILASQRVETLVVQWFGTEEMRLDSLKAMQRQRGQPPSIIETSILLYIIAHIWQETRELWKKGLVTYFQNLWNIIDFVRNSLYVGTVIMRLLAYFQAQAEINANPMSVYIPREAWNAYDPMLIADGFFAAGNVFAALKLVHIFSINPYLGPLQISLGRMVIDIIKFFFIYALVLFAFACGLNQLLWYYSDMEKQQCFSGPGGTENWTQQRDSCLAWRRFSNLFESSQTLFWASFGLVDISNFDLSGIKSYTRFWGLLMFGSYSVINVVVLLNLLIAMMSNSYNVISERADVEWKFARTTLFMNYFEEGSTVPPPFNIFPTVKHFMRLFVNKKTFKDMSFRKKETKMKERDSIYQGVMCNLVWRYVTAQQKSNESHAVTEDNINELRQDVYSFRHELMRVLRGNGMNTQDVELDKVDVTGKRVQVRKRRLIKDFSIGLMEVCTEEAAPEVTSNKSMLSRLVRMSGGETRSSQRWRDLIQAVKKSKIIGNKDNESGRFGSIRKTETKQDVENDATKSPETVNSEFQKTENQEHYLSEATLNEKNSKNLEENLLDCNKLCSKISEDYIVPNNLYPKTSEENLSHAAQNNVYSKVDEDLSGTVLNNVLPKNSGDLSSAVPNGTIYTIPTSKQSKIPIITSKNENVSLIGDPRKDGKRAIPTPGDISKHLSPKKKEAPAIPSRRCDFLINNEIAFQGGSESIKDISDTHPKQTTNMPFAVSTINKTNILDQPNAGSDETRRVVIENQVPKDTAIIVTSSPEKIVHPRSGSLISVEVGHHRSGSPELIDFKDDQEKSSLNLSVNKLELENTSMENMKERSQKTEIKDNSNTGLENANFAVFGSKQSQSTETTVKKKAPMETNITITSVDDMIPSGSFVPDSWI